MLKRLGKLKRAVAQNRTKDTVPTAETIGMRFSEVPLQSRSIRIYVVVSFDRLVLVVFLPPLPPPFHAPNVPPLLAW